MLWSETLSKKALYDELAEASRIRVLADEYYSHLKLQH
jgi:hypothetical protein